MANLFQPYGFRNIGTLAGHPFNAANSKVFIAAADTTPDYFGDPLVRKTNGYVGKAPLGAPQLHGVFIGCQYLSAVKGYTNYSNFFPGNGDALADVTAWVISTMDATFQVQTGNSVAGATAAPATNAMVGLNVGFAYGTPNPRTGISAAYIDLSTAGTSTALPFKIVALVSDPPTVNGADPTTAYNDVIVTFNNTDYRAGTAGI